MIRQIAVSIAELYIIVVNEKSHARADSKRDIDLRPRCLRDIVLKIHRQDKKLVGRLRHIVEQSRIYSVAVERAEFVLHGIEPLASAHKREIEPRI